MRQPCPACTLTIRSKDASGSHGTNLGIAVIAEDSDDSNPELSPLTPPAQSDEAGLRPEPGKTCVDLIWSWSPETRYQILFSLLPKLAPHLKSDVSERSRLTRALLTISEHRPMPAASPESELFHQYFDTQLSQADGAVHFSAYLIPAVQEDYRSGCLPPDQLSDLEQSVLDNFPAEAPSKPKDTDSSPSKRKNSDDHDRRKR